MVITLIIILVLVLVAPIALALVIWTMSLLSLAVGFATNVVMGFLNVIKG